MSNRTPRLSFEPQRNGVRATLNLLFAGVMAACNPVQPVSQGGSTTSISAENGVKEVPPQAIKKTEGLLTVEFEDKVHCENVAMADRKRISELLKDPSGYMIPGANITHFLKCRIGERANDDFYIGEGDDYSIQASYPRHSSRKQLDPAEIGLVPPEFLHATESIYAELVNDPSVRCEDVPRKERAGVLEALARRNEINPNALQPGPVVELIQCQRNDKTDPKKLLIGLNQDHRPTALYPRMAPVPR